ncbi:MAG: phospholipase A, partial [candidate division Zixibacteria bacterium]|nr:phospholipase A [candidate division Zixibacteria bacterium]
YVCPYYYSSNLLLHLKFRYRLPEDDKEAPDAPVGDDNPDITDYLGHAELQVYYNLPHNHTIHLKAFGSFKTGHGGFYLMYNFPVPKSNNSFFTIRFSHGYGESLVDYKKKLTRIGIGISFRR